MIHCELRAMLFEAQYYRLIVLRLIMMLRAMSLAVSELMIVLYAVGVLRAVLLPLYAVVCNTDVFFAYIERQHSDRIKEKYYSIVPCNCVSNVLTYENEVSMCDIIECCSDADIALC